MKIGSFPSNVIPIGSGVRSKRSEGDGGSARQQYDPNQTRHDDGGENGHEKQKKQEDFDPKLIDEALESFKTDASAMEHGLSAEVNGSGPGLKISVKDCNGTTVRQFSGEEFLKLRDAASHKPPSSGSSLAIRGKILDQKL